MIEAMISNSDRQEIRILLIEDRPEHAKILQNILSEEKNLFFRVERAEKLATGLARLKRQKPDLVVLDLGLTDSQGLDTFLKFQSEAPFLPVVVLTGTEDQRLALEVLRRGAQDFVVKGEMDGKMLSRVLRYALERHRLQESIRDLSLKDDLTGLYNRRGFITLAEQHLMLAQRSQREFLILMIDVDALKAVNDRYGHPEGDRALVLASDILKATFRKSDIMARIGGDEFAVMAHDARQTHAARLAGRLRESVDKMNGQGNHPYRLSLSVGIASYDPSAAPSLEQMMSQADQALYADKRAKDPEP